jgi:hypothetical protein
VCGVWVQDYLSGVTREEVEMAVHCDVVVFEWLLAYVEGKPAATLDVSNCVPILISSQFLKVRDSLVASQLCELDSGKHTAKDLRLPSFPQPAMPGQRSSLRWAVKINRKTSQSPLTLTTAHPSPTRTPYGHGSLRNRWTR